MNQIWLQIFAVMVGGSILKMFFHSVVMAVIIEIAVLAVAYLLIRRYPYIDLKRSMLFLGGLTVISILVDIGLLSGMLGDVIILGLLFWMLFGGGAGGGRRPQLRHKWHK
ncbi:MAG: hypothetical protein LLG02_13260 [Pelosinus sp.]|nr:hypothetical protein [Pelosinus sp.]